MTTTSRVSASQHREWVDGRQKRARTDDGDNSDDETVKADPVRYAHLPPPFNRPRRNSTGTVVSATTAMTVLPESTQDSLLEKWNRSTEPERSIVLDGKYFIVPKSVWQEGPRRTALQRIHANKGHVVDTRRLDGVNSRPLLLIPGSAEEEPARSGKAARLAYGIGREAEEYVGLKRVSYSWLVRTILSGVDNVPHDMLGIDNKTPLPPQIGKDGKKSRYRKFDTLENASIMEVHRMHSVLVDMDRFFPGDSKGTAERFFKEREQSGIDKGNSSTKAFVTKFKPVFRDCCPAFSEVCKEVKPGVSENPLLTLAQVSDLAGSGNMTGAGTTTTPHGPHSFRDLDSASSSNGSTDDPTGSSQGRSENAGPSVDLASHDSIRTSRSPPRTLGEAEVDHGAGSEEYGPIEHHEAHSDQATPDIVTDDNPESHFAAQGPLDNTVPDVQEDQHVQASDLAAPEVPALETRSTMTVNSSLRILQDFVQDPSSSKKDGLNQTCIESLLAYARRSLAPESPSPSTAACLALINAMGSLLSSQPEFHFARSDFLASYAELRFRQSHDISVSLEKALGRVVPPGFATPLTRLVTPYEIDDRISIIEIDLASQRATVHLDSPEDEADEDMEIISDTVDRFAVDIIEQADRHCDLTTSIESSWSSASDTEVRYHIMGYTDT